MNENWSPPNGISVHREPESDGRKAGTSSRTPDRRRTARTTVVPGLGRRQSVSPLRIHSTESKTSGWRRSFENNLRRRFFLNSGGRSRMDENWLRPNDISVHREPDSDGRKAGTSSRTPDFRPTATPRVGLRRKKEVAGTVFPLFVVPEPTDGEDYRRAWFGKSAICTPTANPPRSLKR